jgi:hypothetical protein
MEWQRYEGRITWGTSDYDNVQSIDNQYVSDSPISETKNENFKWMQVYTQSWISDWGQLKNWTIRSAIALAKKKTYVIEDEKKFNPSAELARVFELILQRVIEKHYVRPPLSHLVTCSSFMWILDASGKPLSDKKKEHNEVHQWMQVYTQDWISDWGQPTLDSYEWQLEDYLKLSERFYYFYSNVDNLQQDDIDEINEAITLHCNVKLNQINILEPNYLFGIVPENLLGYCWINLAKDIANKNKNRVCARQWCTRILNQNARPDMKSCGNSCSSMLSRSGGGSSKKISHESVFMTVGK